MFTSINLLKHIYGIYGFWSSHYESHHRGAVWFFVPHIDTPCKIHLQHERHTPRQRIHHLAARILLRAHPQMKDRRTSDACVTRYSMWDVLRNAYVAVVPILIFAAKTANAIDPPNCSNTVSLRWSRTSDRWAMKDHEAALAEPITAHAQ